VAENDVDQQERTEQPSAKRLDDARVRGQVPRSRELAVTLVVLTGAAVLHVAGPYFANGLQSLFQLGLSLPRSALLDEAMLGQSLTNACLLALKLIAPLLLALVAAVFVATVLFGGWVFSFDALTPKLGKLNPIAGLKRIFGWHGLSELVKALAKVLVVVLVAAWLLSALAEDFLALGTLTLAAGLERAAWLTTVSFGGLAASLVLIAAADVPFQHWQYRRQMRMTRQEARDEQKETEGRPEVRSRIRSLQRAIATRRMMSDVPKADVVVMNPTHFAVALRYDAANMQAPRVIAKGADLIALNIRRIAEAHKVPVFEHPQFARALFYNCEVGQEISPRLYVAVAQVLTYIYQLTGRAVPGSQPAREPSRQGPRKPELVIDADLLDPAARRRRGARPKVDA
jgi:flagellar biosynthetic protein FlhB